MANKLALSLAALVLLAACEGADPYGPDFNRGVWAGQSINPPSGLLSAQQGPLVGRTVTNTRGPSPLVIDYVLVDPSTGTANYAVVATKQSRDYVIIPVSALRQSPTAITVDASEYTMTNLPHVQVAELERRYPHTILTAAPSSAPAVGALPPVAAVPSLPPATLPPVSPSVEALQLYHRGSVAGMPVYGSDGQPIGTVDAVSVTPATGAIQYLIISNPSWGFNNMIVVPASSAQMAGDRIVLAGSTMSWLQSTRYSNDQVHQTFGSLGTVN
jgi:sporulation protein YlmC with PRC-barrel domain